MLKIKFRYRVSKNELIVIKIISFIGCLLFGYLLFDMVSDGYAMRRRRRYESGSFTYNARLVEYVFFLLFFAWTATFGTMVDDSSNEEK